MSNSITITLYRFAGQWGPFKVKIPCGECTLSEDVIQDCIENELAGIDIKFEQFDWLTRWWEPLKRGGWHAPIVFVDGKLVSQGTALNRGLLTQRVIEAGASKNPVEGNLIYGKQSCPHCTRAKQLLAECNIQARYLDVVKEPRALYEMLARVKVQIGEKTPVTVPQIWLSDQYVGGMDDLEKHLGVQT